MAGDSVDGGTEAARVWYLCVVDVGDSFESGPLRRREISTVAVLMAEALKAENLEAFAGGIPLIQSRWCQTSSISARSS